MSQAGSSPSRSLLLTAAGTLRRGFTGGACSGSSMPNSLARALKAGRFSSRSAEARDRPLFGQCIELRHKFSSYPADGRHVLGGGQVLQLLYMRQGHPSGHPMQGAGWQF